MAYLLIVVLCAITLEISAKDLGVRGHIFEINEEDLIDFITKRLRSVELEEMKKMHAELVKKYKSPVAVHGLQEATTYRTFYFDPTLCSNQDIRDHQGKEIVPKGHCINPLDSIVSLDALLFFDGSNARHLEWAKNQKNLVKWIITKGSPFHLEETENRPVYFDQFGSLVEKFGIRHLPAKVSRDGMRLKIEEIPVGG